MQVNTIQGKEHAFIDSRRTQRSLYGFQNVLASCTAVTRLDISPFCQFHHALVVGWETQAAVLP